MKTYVPLLALLVVGALVTSVGFQCGSTEMTSARLYISRSEWDNAIKNLEAELAKNPKNEEAWYLLGRVKAEKMDFAGMNYGFDHALEVGQTYAKEIHDVRFNYWGRYLNIGVESFNKARDANLKIGMTKDELIQRLGRPDTVNKTVTEFGASEQWVYSKLDLYAYFDENVLKGWQEFNKAVSTSGEANIFLDKAIAAFQTSIVINPDSAAAYKNLAFCYLSKNEMGKALGNLEKAFALSNDVVSARYIGEINHEIGANHKAKFESPENKTEVKIWMTPDEVRALLGEPTSKSSTKEKKITKEKWVYAPKKLTLNFEDGQIRSWEENGKKEDRNPKVYYKDYAERDSAMKYFEKSIAYLEKAVKRIQQHLEARPEKRLKVGMSEQEVRALIGLPKSVNSTTTEFGQADQWVYDTFKLYLYLQGGALKGWQAYERNPDELLLSDLIALLSNVYIAADKGETALETFKSGVEADPSNKFFHYNYGVLLLKGIDFEKALEQFQAALTLDSTYEVALYNLAVGYVNWGVHIRETAPDPTKVESVIKEKFKLALPYLEKMTRLKPQDPEAWELLGKVFANLGMSKEATATFEKADKLRKEQQ